MLSSRNAFGVRREDGAKVSVDRDRQYGNNGISTSGANSTIRIKDVTIFGSVTGINTSGGGTVSSFSPASTANAGNGTPGAPHGAIVPLQ